MHAVGARHGLAWPAIALVVLTGAVSQGWTATDVTAPAAILDLAASSPSKAPQLHVTLTWTAPGDDGSGGGSATAYDIRYRTDSPVTELNWGTATPVAGEPVPGAPGSVQSFTVVGLKPSTTYHFAVKSSDEVPNVSVVSNSPSLATAKYEGYGYQTVGGGERPIFHVTSLADSGTGTLRDALSAGNRYIVFDVGGTITLQTLLDTRATASSFITVDGSTAPSPGITLKQATPLNDGWRIGNEDNVIIAYLRFEGVHTWTGPDAVDDLMTTNATVGSTVSNLVWDHLTVRNVGDAAADLWHRVQDTTISYCYFLFNKHPMTSGGDAPSNRITIHHNLWADNGERLPQLVDVHRDMEIVNNLFYQWGYNPNPGAGYSVGTYGIRIRNTPAGATDANILNNYFLAGPTHANAALVYGSTPGPDAGEENGPTTCKKQGSVFVSSMGQLWVAGNVFPSSNCDEYSTVTAPRPVPASAQVTLDPASGVGTRVLLAAGTHYRKADEQTVADGIASLLGNVAVCGNNLREPGEVCDGTDLAGSTCVSLGFSAGTLTCGATCASFNTSLCINANPSDVKNLRRSDTTP